MMRYAPLIWILVVILALVFVVMTMFCRRGTTESGQDSLAEAMPHETDPAMPSGMSREPDTHLFPCTYDVVWWGPFGREDWTGISTWCGGGGMCHGSALHFVDPRTKRWISIGGTYKCTRIDRVERPR